MQIVNSAPLVIVEDNDEDFETFSYAYRSAGGKNRLIRMPDGQELLDYLNRRGKFSTDDDFLRPGLIILDLNLPGIDGRQVLTKIKSDEGLCSIPVMVLTTSANPADIQSCYREGANCYTIKPVDLPRFERLVWLIKEFWFDNIILPDNPESLIPA